MNESLARVKEAVQRAQHDPDNASVSWNLLSLCFCKFLGPRCDKLGVNPLFLAINYKPSSSQNKYFISKTNLPDDYTLRAVNIGNVVYDKIVHEVELQVKRVAHEHKWQEQTVADVRRLHNNNSAAKELLDLSLPFCANMRYVLYYL